ncbi:integrase domain-containing protein [Lysobacter sp. GCM10012299]|uniref:integrase domain-containing protein n=1 Tax=Lysobacter sp. GCM10012299 TaxID=3317333 RepID=UPI003611EBA8
MRVSKRTKAVSAARGAAKDRGGAHLTKQARMGTMGRLFALLHDRGYQVADVEGLREKHIALYFDARKSEEKKVRTLQNEASHIRGAMRAVGRAQAADSPTISNKALGISGSCRDGTKVAASDEQFRAALEIAKGIDAGLVALFKLERTLGLRGAEAVQSGPSLSTWERQLAAGERVKVIFGTKGGRPRDSRAPDLEKASGAVREALAVAAKRGGKIIDKRGLKAAMTWYRNTVHRHVTEPLDLQAHALRYAYACDLLDLYQKEAFSMAEADAQTSMDLGHGDGRGRYVRKVYGRREGI